MEQSNMKIYVGRWDLLPEDWEGYNGLSKMDSWDASEEVSREKRHHEDNLIGEYDAAEFEDTFNQDLEGAFNTKEYWIKIF